MAKGIRTGGRKRGVPNKATAEVKEVAKQYGPDAIRKLAELAGLVKGVSPAQSEQAQVAANREILDRAYGRPSQSIIAEGQGAMPVLGVVMVPAKTGC